MPSTIQCPYCGTGHALTSEDAGSRSTCSRCGQAFVLTHSPSATPQAPGRDAPGNPRLPQVGAFGNGARIGHFDVIRVLGEGEFGVVYLARDVTLDRPVALKVCKSKVWASPEAKQRAQREPKLAAQLLHPNIAAVFEANVHAEMDGQEQFYIASEYVDGQTLQAHMASQTLGFHHAATIVMKLADALSFAHERGIVHRDVKPANVVLDRDLEPKLTDFGLARLMDTGHDLTKSHGLLGTPAYMSPEQAASRNELIGPASDQYGLGVVLYEMLTGQAPFFAHDLLALVIQIRTEAPRPPRQIKPDIPSALEAICLRAMSKNPLDRFATTGKMRDALRQYLSSSLDAAHYAPPISRQEFAPPISAEPSPGIVVAELVHRPPTPSLGYRSAAPPKQSRGMPYELLVIGSLVGVCALIGILILVVAALNVDEMSTGSVELVVQGDATGSTFRIDGKLISEAEIEEPIELPEGAHEIVITGSDIEPYFKSFNVLENKRQVLFVTLTPRSTGAATAPAGGTSQSQ